MAAKRACDPTTCLKEKRKLVLVENEVVTHILARKSYTVGDHLKSTDAGFSLYLGAGM